MRNTSVPRLCRERTESNGGQTEINGDCSLRTQAQTPYTLFAPYTLFLPSRSSACALITPALPGKNGKEQEQTVKNRNQRGLFLAHLGANSVLSVHSVHSVPPQPILSLCAHHSGSAAYNKKHFTEPIELHTFTHQRRSLHPLRKRSLNIPIYNSGLHPADGCW